MSGADVELTRPPYEPPVISASRLKTVGGEKGAPGCERKLAGAYVFGMKQASTPALERGTILHGSAEVYQATGVIPDPESEESIILAAGAHLLTTCGKMLVEYEHRGFLPDGSPFVAYMDGHSPNGGPCNTVVIQDIKTSGSPRHALTGADENGEGDTDPNVDHYHLLNDIQSMLYAWILLCCKHEYRKDENSPWMVWDPEVMFETPRARNARLRWIYFLTKGNPRAWEVNAFVLPPAAEAFMTSVILPLVSKINALHQWHYSNPHGSIDDVEPNGRACDGRGRWCGVYEHNACQFDRLGTPLLDLVQLKVRKVTTPQERIAAVRARQQAAAAAAGGAPPAAPAPVEAPAATPPPAVVAAATSVATSAPASPSSVPVAPDSATPAPAAAEGELSRGQKAALTRAQNLAAAKARVAAAAAGAPAAEGINPPAEVAPPAAAAAPTTAPSGADLGALLVEIRDLLKAGLKVQVTVGGGAK